jgi:MFS family permease
MPGRSLAALLVASALVTFDGTAATVSLPAIAENLHASISKMQWIGGAPLLTMAALLLTGGALADRYGRLRLLRAGLVVFAAGSAMCALAPSAIMLIAARMLQGVGAAFILPAAVAHLRAVYSEPVERTRRFGIWAAWTGVASAVGPMLGGLLADVLSWRAIFVTSSAAAAAAFVLMNGTRDSESVRGAPLPIVQTFALAVVLGASASLLIGARTSSWSSPQTLIMAGLIPLSAGVLLRSAPHGSLLPRELLTARNCVTANGATFGLYFGMFGLPFLLALYTQQELGYSGVWAGAGLLPISLMLFLAEPFGRFASRMGTRTLIVLGSIAAASGILWMGAGPHPLAFWSRIVIGTTLFGLGISLAVSPLTHAAVSAVPERCAGAASGFNHATVRAAGLAAIALLGFVAADGQSDGVSIDGFRRAMIICGAVVAACGLAGGLTIRNDEPGGLGHAGSVEAERLQRASTMKDDRERDVVDRKEQGQPGQ